MNKVILMSVFALFIVISSNAQSGDKKAIRETIVGFSNAGDKNDADKLASYLDDSYRIVMNRLFGSKEVSVMSRDVYLEKIRTKEFGGDNRKVEIESIVINGSTASAKVSFNGSKMTSVSILSLVRDENNDWKLVSDMPIVN